MFCASCVDRSRFEFGYVCIIELSCVDACMEAKKPLAPLLSSTLFVVQLLDRLGRCCSGRIFVLCAL